MQRFTVTLSREWGCNAREIGRQLAAKLGIRFYDRELVDMAARKAGVNNEFFSQSDEKSKAVDSFYNEWSYGSSTAFYSEKAIEAQAWVIRKIANEESCVMLGRCSDYFLREFNNIMNIFLYAPLDYRIKHISETYKFDERTAGKMIKRIDRQRHDYYKYITGKSRGDRHLKNLMIDVEMFGTEKTVNIIYDTLAHKFEL